MNSFKAILLIVCLVNQTIDGFLIHNYGNGISINKQGGGSFQLLSNRQKDSVASDSSVLTVESYKHKTWNLTYLYKKAAPGHEKDPPIILVHPVGVGISSWFYKKLMTEFTDNPPLYAPDLIGCGLSHGADAWDPEKIGLFFPLSWVEGVESLLNTVALPRWRDAQKSFFFPNYLDKSASSSKGCLVLVQGGLVRFEI